MYLQRNAHPICLRVTNGLIGLQVGREVTSVFQYELKKKYVHNIFLIFL